VTVVSCPPFLRWKCGSLVELNWRGIVNKRRAYPSGPTRRKKTRGKNEIGGNCSQVVKHPSDYFTVAVKSTRDISAERLRGQNI